MRKPKELVDMSIKDLIDMYRIYNQQIGSFQDSKHLEDYEKGAKQVKKILMKKIRQLTEA